MATEPKQTGDIVTYIFGMLFQQTVTFASGLVVAHWLGPAGYGLTSLLRNLFAVSLIVAPLGLDLALLRHVNEQGGASPQIMAQISRMRFIVAAISTAILLLVAEWLGPWAESHAYNIPHFSMLLTLSFVGFPFAADSAIMAATFRSLNRPAIQNMANLLLQPTVRFIFLVAGLSMGLGISAAVGATAMGAVASFIAMALALRRLMQRNHWKGHRLDEADYSQIRKVFSYSIWLSITLLMYGLLRSVDILILGKFRGVKEVGEYAAISVIAQLISVYPQALSQTLGPTISKYHHSKRPELVKLALTNYIRRSVLLTSPIFAAVSVFGPWLSLIFGARFEFRQSLSFNLALVYFISSVFSPMGYSLSMTGSHKLELRILFIGTTVSTLSCLLLAPTFGGNGVAIGITIGYLLIDVTRTVFVSRRLGFVPGSWRDFAPPLTCALVAAVVDLASIKLGRPSLLLMGVDGIICIAVIGAIYWWILLKTSERIYIIESINKMLIYSKRLRR